MSNNTPDEDYWDDYSTPFRYEENMALAELERRELANEAVKSAIETYNKKTWLQKLPGRIRASLYWFTYKLRLRLALFVISSFGKRDDLQFVQKVFFRLGV